MSLLIKNHFENAIESLKSNRMRTYLSIFGITVGIASITIILSLLAGAGSLFGKQAAKASDTTALIRSGHEARPDSLLSLSSGSSAYLVNTLTEQDVRELAKVSDNRAAPLASLQATITTPDGKGKIERASIIGTTGNLAQMTGLKMLEGQFIDEADNAVISKQLSIDLFGSERSLGNIIKIHDQPFTVVGILDNADPSLNYLGVDLNRSIILPISKSKRLTQNTAQIQQIALTAKNGTELQQIIDKAKPIITRQHNDNDDFHILIGNAITGPSSHLINAVSITIAIIAGISLLVGGISITNVMLVSVAERQREVGIRKSVGATNRTIVGQFLIEAAIIGLLSGFLGYAIGLGTSIVLGMYLPFTPVITWQSALTVIGISLGIGTIFGIYPAMRAARKDPIQTLHY
ncbi:MAG: ABC transporter permease [Candidatus Saccharibacteria bacterium]|nr:ABC transporter permease [Candidatus Saccharibacteria bacterium]